MILVETLLPEKRDLHDTQPQPQPASKKPEPPLPAQAESCLATKLNSDFHASDLKNVSGPTRSKGHISTRRRLAGSRRIPNMYQQNKENK
jgi:hypothetical protein